MTVAPTPGRGRPGTPLRRPGPRFSAEHAITSKEAWIVALLAMAVFDVSGRALVWALRRRHLIHAAPPGASRWCGMTPETRQALAKRRVPGHASHSPRPRTQRAKDAYPRHGGTVHLTPFRPRSRRRDSQARKSSVVTAIPISEGTVRTIGAPSYERPRRSAPGAYGLRGSADPVTDVAIHVVLSSC